MQNKSRAFTLIELLVVVLIIGILAAVAVPQYQKAVDKTKYTQAMVLLEHIWQAQQVYKLANGSYALYFDELGADMPTPTSNTKDTYVYPWGNCSIHNTGYVKCAVKLGRTAHAWYFAYLSSRARYCWAEPQEDTRANILCKTVTKKTTGSPQGDWYMQYKF